jgi:hypothetical protein
MRELISTLNHFGIRVSLAHGGIRKLIWLGGCIIHEREGDLRRIDLGFVREKFCRETEEDFQENRVHFQHQAEAESLSH